MNKKFSTLMAGILLASGLFSTANAIDVKNAKPGQYYQLARNANYDGSAWDDEYSYRLVDNGTRVVLDATVTGDASYWTIQTRTNTSGDNEARFVNVKTGKALKMEGKEWFRTEAVTTGLSLGGVTGAVANGLRLKDSSGAELWIGTERDGSSWPVYMYASGSFDGTTKWGITFDAEKVAPTVYSETMLNEVLGTSFGLRIGFLNDDDAFEDYDLQGAEAFSGNLTAKTGALYNGATDAIAGATTSPNVHIWNNAAKKYVVLTKHVWGGQIDADGSQGKGFKFALMTGAEIKADLAKTNPTILTATFQITAEANADGRLEVAAVDVYGSGHDAELFVYKNDGKYYLTVNQAYTDPNTGDVTDGNADEVANYRANTWVKFGLTNTLKVKDFYGYAVTIRGTKGANSGKTIHPQGNGWISTEYVGMTKPEGQWIVTTDVQGEVKWINRETGEETRGFDGMRLVSGDIYTTGNDQNYEIKKTDKLGGDTYEYYGEYEPNNAAYGDPHTYKIALNNATSSVTEYVSINGRGELILTNDKNAAIIFDLHKTVMTNDIKSDGTVDADKLVDRFHIINNAMIWDKRNEEWVYTEDADTVSFYRYNFSYNGKYLAFGGNDRMVLSPNAPGSFVIKEKDGDVLNIIHVDGRDYDDNGTAEVYDLEKWISGRYLLTEYDDDNDGDYSDVGDARPAQMLYFDENKAILRQETDIYRWNANAQLTIDEKDEIAYRTLTIAPDTMEFYRVEYADEFLFENGHFLGMTYNRDKYNPAIFVDTAYVRYNTKKPMYLLAVGVDKTDASKVCPVCGKADCEHAEDVPGMVSARYLVSYTDSVAKYSALLNNPFCYTGTRLTKLGFVPAVHYVDSLFIPNMKEPEMKWVFDGEGVSPVTFAFRIVNAETEDFVIESALRNANGTYRVAYIKWHNGCPVLTDYFNEAEVFNVRETSASPTNNEAIATSEVVVIAGEGNVTIAGAAGKRVVISNILGQVVANTVITSDNATIAAPQGVVVVAVEGEEAVKAIVK